MRSFNTAGPVKPDKHYCIPPLERIDLDEVLRLVRDEQYFVLHAPRQTGKTTALLALADVLNGRGYGCVYATVETARTAPHDVQRAMRTVLVRLAHRRRGRRWMTGFLDDIWPDVLARVGADEALGEALSRWAQASARPLVLLIDEIDTLVGDSLLSVLQQLRAGYPGRPERFPHSVVLSGMRDLRDYRMGAAGSPFNIAAEVAAAGRLLARADAGAAGPAHGGDRPGVRAGGAGGGVDADPRPALAGERAGARDVLQEQGVAGRPLAHGDRGCDIAAVREDLIVNRVTHLDYLADKLREDRVRRVIEPMLSAQRTGTTLPTAISHSAPVAWMAGRRCGWPTQRMPEAALPTRLHRSAGRATCVGGAGDAGCVARRGT